MRSEVTIAFQGVSPVRIDLDEVQPMPIDVARWWLDDQFTQMGCEPLRLTGKLVNCRHGGGGCPSGWSRKID